MWSLEEGCRYSMSLQWILVFFDVCVSTFGVEEMLQSRVQPSNITFSILVKLHFEAQQSDYSMWNMAAVYPSPIVARVEGEGCARLKLWHLPNEALALITCHLVVTCAANRLMNKGCLIDWVTPSEMTCNIEIESDRVLQVLRVLWVLYILSLPADLPKVGQIAEAFRLVPTFLCCP